MSAQPTAKRALVTGGGSGQGLAIAGRFMARGASVLICGHEADVLEEAAEDLRSLGSGGCETLTANLIDPEQAVGAVETCVAAFGGIEVLVNNAGFWEQGDWGEMTAESWDRSMNLMARAPMLMIQAALPHMGDRGGRVINTSSTSGKASEYGSTQYSAAKAALISVTESAAVDLAKRGICVNALAPGWIRSAMSEAYLAGLTAEQFAALNPMGRPGDPDDVAKVAEFLAFDAPDYLTGHTIFIDGGQSVHLVQPGLEAQRPEQGI